ncbi:hypothetical protein EV148_10784 [Dokdonella fugitiva]|jgi:hypothetical protein|uniref:Uncharacterized protein n=1 Tax=Dokdonella fugitiva TaxID=328517 RepID=A0A4R2I4S2_9GAMM|nr:hypothetical protein [Dokdonella fugitiva]TCO38796.1 hypothetical protein EV148_10784 [Dokdonella fugitiva]
MSTSGAAIARLVDAPGAPYASATSTLLVMAP